MTSLPNPFDSGASTASTPDEAAADISPRSPAAAADISSATEGRIEGAPASTSTVTVAAGDAGDLQVLLSAIGDDHRFVLDEARFLADIEPPPLFLQRVV